MVRPSRRLPTHGGLISTIWKDPKQDTALPLHLASWALDPAPVPRCLLQAIGSVCQPLPASLPMGLWVPGQYGPCLSPLCSPRVHSCLGSPAHPPIQWGTIGGPPQESRGLSLLTPTSLHTRLISFPGGRKRWDLQLCPWLFCPALCAFFVPGTHHPSPVPGIWVFASLSRLSCRKAGPASRPLQHPPHRLGWCHRFE